MDITKNYQSISQSIQDQYSNIKIIVAIKNHSIDEILLCIKAGAKYLGINKWQQFETVLLPSLSKLNCELHFIGHLQTNKVKFVVKYFNCIQSVDSFRTAEIINNECIKLNKIMPMFLQINISYDPNKFGVIPKNLELLLPQIQKLSNIKLYGLMAITAIEDEKQTREDYHNLYQLFLHYKEKYHLTELSMGMSQDYKIALQEGATMVRIGSAIFK